mmetsp:Transcript_4431/g.16225  ORF Transcript_4431/g.16225 Transcript_4431/m.16225 type:complete len:233 (+) Transcript_4431:1248-1946(+)
MLRSFPGLTLTTTHTRAPSICSLVLNARNPLQICRSPNSPNEIFSAQSLSASGCSHAVSMRPTRMSKHDTSMFTVDTFGLSSFFFFSCPLVDGALGFFSTGAATSNRGTADAASAYASSPLAPPRALTNAAQRLACTSASLDALIAAIDAQYTDASAAVNTCPHIVARVARCASSVANVVASVAANALQVATSAAISGVSAAAGVANAAVMVSRDMSRVDAWLGARERGGGE